MRRNRSKTQSHLKMFDPSEVGFLDEDYEEARWREKKRAPRELPIEYWTLQKLVKFMKIGNQVVTNACLCCIRDYDLTKQLNQRAIFSVGGLDTLVNLCKTSDYVCRIGALYVLKDMSTNIDMRRYMIDMNLIELLSKIVTEPLMDLKCLSIDILGNLGVVKAGRKLIHKSDVVNKIIDGLNFDRALLHKKRKAMTPKEEAQLVLAISCAKALSQLLQSNKILNEAKKGGLILSINHLLKTIHMPLISAVLGLCHVCSRDISVQLGLETELVIVDVTKQLTSKDTELLTNVCGVLASCGQHPKTSKIIQQNGGLKSIIGILSNENNWANDQLMLTASAAAYTCVEHLAAEFNKLNVLPTLAQFLSHGFNDNILANICGLTSQLLYEPHFIRLFLEHTTLEKILDFFYIEHDNLRIETCRIITQLCKHSKYAEQMRALDGIRYLWTQLRSENALVQLAASTTLCQYMRNDKKSAEYVRKLDNGLELVANLLKSTDETTLIATCALIVEIAKDSYNLAILTEYNVVMLLSKLIHDHNRNLEESVVTAVASCTPYADNAKQFGELKVLRPIVNLVCSDNPKVRCAAALALEKLSAYQINAMTIAQSGIYPVLLQDIHSDDPVLRNGAANCLRNMRELTLKAEQYLMMEIEDKTETSK